MFGETPADTAQNMGAPVGGQNITYGDSSTAMENLGTAFNAGRFPGEQGSRELLSDEMQKRSDQVEQLTGSPSYVYHADPGMLGVINGTATDPYAGKLPGVQQQLEEEKRLDQLRAQGMPIPTYQDMVNNVNRTVGEIQNEADDVAARSSGFVSGTLPRLAGGMASGLTPENPLVAASTFMGAPAFNSVLARLGWAGLQNGAVSLAGSYLAEKPQAEAFGQPFSDEDAFKSAGYAATLGVAFHGATEGARFFFPEKAPAQISDVNKNFSDLSKTTTPEGKFAADLATAKTPQEAVRMAAERPTPVVADTIAATDPQATSGVRAVLQGAEHEILAEGSQPPGTTWDEHVGNLQKVNDAIEQGHPLPDLTPAETERTPVDDVLDSLRSGTVSRETQPPTLLQFLADHGGVRDEGGEMSAMDADKWHLGKPFQRKLVTDGGMPLDDAARAAHEAGYFNDESSRPSINDFLEKVEQELRGRKAYPGEVDDTDAADTKIKEQFQRFMDENGLDLNVNTNAEIKAAMDAAQAEPHAQLQEAAHADDIGAREEADIEREMKELHEGAAAMEQVKQMPELKDLSFADKKAMLDKFGKYDLDEVVPLGEMSVDENGQLVGKGVTLRELLADIEGDRELLHAMITCAKG